MELEFAAYLDLIFKIVSISIGIYIIASYLINIRIVDDSQRKLQAKSRLDINAVLYIEIFMGGAILSWGMMELIKNKLDFLLTAEMYIAALILIVTNILSAISHKNKHIKKFNPLLAITIVGFFSGFLIEPILRNLTVNLTVASMDLLLFVILTFSGLLLSGRLRKDKYVEVELIFADVDTFNYFKSNGYYNRLACNNSQVESIEATLIDEADDSYFLILNNKNFRVNKDQIAVIKEI